MKPSFQFSSVAQSCPVLQPYEWQHARPPCPSQTPRVYPNSCSLSRWCHPTISSSATLFSSCPQSLPASESFPKSQLFTSGGQSSGASASAPVLSTNIQGSFPLGWTAPTPQFKSINSLALSLLYGPTLKSLDDYWKSHSFDYTDFCWQSKVSTLIHCLGLS